MDDDISAPAAQPGETAVPALRRRATLKTVAHAAGVSPALASFALNGKPGVSPEKREEILRAARELGYQPDTLARELRTGKTAVHGLIVRNIANPYFNDVLAGMQEAAFEHDITVLAMDSEYSEDRERRHIRHLAARRVNSLAIAPVGSAHVVQEWLTLRPGARTVLINSSTHLGPGIPRVSPDGGRAVTMAFEHLRALGHQRIGFLTAPEALRSDEDRLARFVELCREARAEPVVISAELQGAAITTAIVSALRSRPAPTAIITNSDFAAHYVYMAAHELELRIGDDLSIVGHDDLPTSQLLNPSLTTIAVDRRRLGREAFRRLFGAADGDYHGGVSLVARDSTRPPRPQP